MSSGSASTQNQFISNGGQLSIPISQTLISVPAATTALNVTVAQQGSTYLIPILTGACTVTLPAVALCAGCKWTFIAVGILSNAATISSTAVIQGLVINNNAGTLSGVLKTLATAVTMTANAAIGDTVSITSDGVYFYVTGQSKVAAGLS